MTTILIHGMIPNPRRTGVTSVVHDQILALNELGVSSLLIFSARALDLDAPISQFFLCQIPAGVAFDWQDVVSRRIFFDGFQEFVRLLDDGNLPQLREELSRVTVFHSHSDSIIPRDSADSSGNNYLTLLDYIERVSGRRPKFVRTRHDDLQSGLDRLMRLTGIDFVALSVDEKNACLRNGSELIPLVEQRIRNHRNELISQNCSEDFLDQAIHHVWWVTAQLQLWQREQTDADAIVSLCPLAALELRNLLPNSRDNLTYVYNGTSFKRQDKASVDKLLMDYHTRASLECYRAGSWEKQRIRFTTEEKKMIFVGRDDIGKGINEFVRAAEKLYHGGYSHVRAIVAGNFSQPRRRQLCKHDTRHASEYLLFTGHIADPNELAAVMAFGNVTAVCSYYDPFNLVGCESYLMGTPCVVTERTGAADVYLTNPAQHGEKIALPIRKPYAAGINRFFGVDSDSLAAQIAFLLDDDELAYSLGQAGKRFVETHYNYLTMGEHYLDLYERLLSGEGTR